MSETSEHIDLYTLAVKMLDGSISDDEKVIFQKLITDSENKKEFEAISMLWNSASTPHIKVDSDKAFAKIERRIAKSEIKNNKLNIKHFISIAASIVIIVASIVYLKNIYSTNSKIKQIAQQEYTKYTSTDSSLNIILPDSSIVILAPYSSITYFDTYNLINRVVNFTGVAFFDIKHNPDKKFKINTNKIEVTVLGTSFYIKETDTNFSVMVQTGRVMLNETNKKENNVILATGESNEFDIQKSEFKTTQNSQNDMFWHTKELKFVREELSTVIITVEKCYNVDINLNEKLSDCKLTASFKANTIEEILDVITNTLGLSYKKEINTFYIYGEACN